MTTRIETRRLAARAWAATLAVLILLAGADRADATKYAGAFMDDGGGARALALGGAFTALADDPSAAYWNPAGLSLADHRALMVMHSERFGDLVDRQYVSYVQPVEWSLFGGEDSGFGVSLIRLGVDDIPFTEHLEDALDVNGDGVVDDDELLGLFQMRDRIEFKSDAEYGLFVSYSERHGSWLLGGSLKVIHQNVGDYSSWGLGLDAGLLRRGLWGNLDVALKLQDVTTTRLMWDTGDDTTNETIVPALIPAFAYRVPLPSWNAEVTFATSFETRFEDRGGADQYSSGSLSTNVHTGVEVGFSRRVYLRGGFDSGWNSENATLGAGFHIDPMIVDYAYAGDTLGIDESTHRISVIFDIDAFF